jgi:uncharacterized protein
VIGAPTLVLLAKAPVPGRVKTRLCPPCTPAQAAAVAEAALRDTLDAMAGVPEASLVLALDGTAGSWLPGGVACVPQRGSGLDERLAAAFSDLGRPALLLGMDTPQASPDVLAAAWGELAAGADAVLGLAEDGGYWLVGLRDAAADDFLGVPMSTTMTGAEQLRRLEERGRRVALLPTLRDVDRWEDACAVAEALPGSRFARAVGAVTGLVPAVA